MKRRRSSTASSSRLGDRVRAYDCSAVLNVYRWSRERSVRLADEKMASFCATESRIRSAGRPRMDGWTGCGSQSALFAACQSVMPVS